MANMDNRIKNILLKFDEQGRYETPSHFSREQIKSKVYDFVKDLEYAFKTQFTIDDQIQDASFFCDVRIPHDLVINPKGNVGYAIRISNFGNLASIIFEDQYSEEVSVTIKDILTKNNFAFIHSDDLDEEYDGSFENFNDIVPGSKPTWWIRYFDYL
jgi:hypothetical protein